MLFILSTILSPVLMAQPIISNHNCTNIKEIPESAILQAKMSLHIAYGHTSHGSQLTTGMKKLDNFMGGTGLYKWHDGHQEGSLDIDDRFTGGDLGHTGDTTWASRTRTYLDDSNNSDVNVIIWSWCGGVSDNTEEGIQTYLDKMNQLEHNYPNIKFVYMTGHSYINRDEQTKTNNQQIRDYCIANNKILFDFEDIEYYNPNGKYFEFVTDNCDYFDSNTSSRVKLGNWAKEWQDSHTEGSDWYNCTSAHSEPLNANRKAYAAWWLWAKLAGWSGVTSIDNKNDIPKEYTLQQNYPNPFNPTTTIQYSIPVMGTNFVSTTNVTLIIYNLIGKEVATLVNEGQTSGHYKVAFNASSLPSNVYFYRITIGDFSKTKQMVLMK